jgi:hypothetical protein
LEHDPDPDKGVLLKPDQILAHEAFIAPDAGMVHVDVHEASAGGELDAFLVTDTGREQLQAINVISGQQENGINLNRYEDGGDVENALTGLDTVEWVLPSQDVGKAATLEFLSSGNSGATIAHVGFGNKALQFGVPDNATANPSNPDHTRYLIDRPQYALSYNDNKQEANYSA